MPATLGQPSHSQFDFNSCHPTYVSAVSIPATKDHPGSPATAHIQANSQGCGGVHPDVKVKHRKFFKHMGRIWQHKGF